MKDTDLNKAQTETPKPDTFCTPWQKQLFGKSQQLLLNRSEKGVVTVQVISKVPSSNAFANFFGKRSETVEKFNVDAEKTFTNISFERFENEKEEIQKLLDKHTYLNFILRKIENDLKAPTLSPEEIEQRQETLNKMQAEMAALIAKIDEEESSPELLSYEELKSSIAKIKKASQTAFLKISDFQERLTDSSILLSQFEELANEINQIETSNNRWSKDFETVRKTFSIEKDTLLAEIEQLSPEMQALPSDLKKSWDELTAKWKKSPLASMAQIRQYRQDIAKATAQITEKYQKNLNNTINTSLLELQRNLDATRPDFSNPEKQQDHLDFRNHILAYRKDIWMSMNDLWNNSQKDPETIRALEQFILKEKAIDHSLVNSLEITAPEESYTDKFFALISPLTSMITPLIMEPPHVLLAEKERFDNAAFFYIEHMFEKMSLTINNLAELIPYEDTDELIAQYNELLETESLMQSELNAHIDKMISFAQLAIRSDANLNRHGINEAITNLQGQKEILSAIIKTQHQHAGTIIKKTKEEFSAAFDTKTRPSIFDKAMSAVNEMLSSDDSDYDLKTLSTEWGHNRNSISKKFEIVKHLENLESLQKGYQETAKKREKEIASLTGEEKINAEEILQELKECIDSLDKTLGTDSADAAMASSYKRKLSRINDAFNPIFEIENQKKELRFQLNKEIEAFSGYIDQCNKAIVELEKHYSIDLNDAKELVKSKLESIKVWKENGQLPSSYLQYAPGSALSALLYYAPSQLTFQEAKAIDLSLNDLSFYIDNLRAVIGNHKNELSSHRVLESYSALKSFLDASKKLEAQSRNLISALTPKANSAGNIQYQVPNNLSTSSLNKLQFHNAALTSERQKKVADLQMKAISAKPDLKFIHQKLTNDISALGNILEQSQKGQMLSLLDQIQKLDNFPDKQELAKKAFVETVTTKMSEYTKSMNDKAYAFIKYPKIHEEAVRQIQRSEADFFKRIASAPQAIQEHAEGWHAIVDGNPNFTTKGNLDINSLSTTDLKNYLDAVDKTIKQGNDYVKLVQNTFDSVKHASQMFEQKIKDANKALQTLNKNNQLIEMQRLQDIITRAEKAKNEFIAADEKKDEEEEFFPSLSFFTTAPKNANPTHAALQLLRRYKELLGENISKIDAALRKIKQGTILTIPQQLGMKPDSKTAELLRLRFQKEVEPLIHTRRSELEKYKNGKSSVAYIRYVSSSSSLMRNIEQAIDSKLEELDELEKGYTGSGLWYKAIGPTAVSELSLKEMEEYQRRLTRLETTLKDDLNKKFQLDNLISVQFDYEKKLNDSVKNQLAILRDNNLFTEAFLLERKIEEITKKEGKWVGKITDEGQLRKLVTDIKTLTREIGSALDEFHPKKTADTYEAQIDQLLKRREEYSNRIINWLKGDPKNQEILDQINADIAMLKNKLAAKIDGGYDKHVNNLIEIKNQIDEAYSTYYITIPRGPVDNALNSEIGKFEDEGGKFESHQYQFLDRLTSPGTTANSLVKYVTNTRKLVSEMEPEEIVQLSPEKNHNAVIERSLKKISASFNYKLIQEPHAAYQKAIEEAEKTEATLNRKESKPNKTEQLLHAAKLEEKIKLIKNKHENCAKKIINNDATLNERAKEIWELSNELKAAESHATHLPVMDMDEQIDQIHTIPINSPYREKFKRVIAQQIQEMTNNPQELSNKSMQYLDDLTHKLGLPYKWRETIISELDASVEEFENNNAKLVAEFSKNHALGQPNGTPSFSKKAVDIFKKGYNFFNADLDPTLSDFSLDDLISIRKTLKSEKTSVKGIASKYNLKKLNEQLTSYENQVKATEKLKDEWSQEYYFSSAKKLGKLVSDANSNIQEYFQSCDDTNLQKNLADLVVKLKKETNDLYYQTAQIKKDKPKSLGELLKTEKIGSPQYITLCKAIHKKLKAKISDYKSVLTTFFKRIDQINAQIPQKTPECPLLPDSWRNAIEENIAKKLDSLNKEADGLSSAKGKVNPFEKWTPEAILSYEQRINALCAKENEPKANETSGLAFLEGHMQLKNLEKGFANYQKAIKHLEALIAKPNISEKSKITLKAIFEAINTLVYSSINNMQHTCDAISLYDTLDLAQATIYRASQESSSVITPGPWATILQFEKYNSGEIFPESAFDEIINKNYSIGYPSQDPDIKGQKEFKAVSLDTQIDIAKKQFEATRISFENKIQLLDKTLPEYFILDNFLKVKLPAIQEELNFLEGKVHIQDEYGNSSELYKCDIKTFKDIVAYKLQINKCLGSFFEEMEILHNLNIYPDDGREKGVAPTTVNGAVLVGGPSGYQDSNSSSASSTQPSQSSKPASVDDTFSVPNISLSSVQKDTKTTISENLKQLQILINSLDVIKAYEASFNNLGSCTIRDLDNLAYNQTNQKMIDACKNFKNVWDSDFREKLQKEANIIGRKLQNKLNSILTINEDAEFKTKLLQEYKKIMRTDEPMSDEWSIAESLDHLNNLANVQNITVHFENIAKYCHHINDLILQANKTLIDGNSTFLSEAVVEKWVMALKNCSKISSEANLVENEAQLQKLTNDCEAILKDDHWLRNEKKSVLAEIEKIRKKFTKQIGLMETLGGCKYTSFKQYLYGKIDSLEIKELSSSGVQQFKTNIVPMLDTIKQSGINQGYIAAKKFQALIPETKKKIDALRATQQFAAAQKLQSHLDSAKKLFNSVVGNFERFAINMESLVLNIKTELDAKENKIDFISQLKQISDPEDCKTIIENLINELIEKAQKVEESFDGQNTAISNKIRDELNKLILTAKDLAPRPAKKQDFIDHISLCEKKFTVFSNIATATSKLSECFEKADVVLEEVNAKKPIQFVVNKISKLKTELKDFIDEFIKYFNMNKPLDELIAKSDQLTKILTSFETSLEEIRKKKKMTPFDQLAAADKELGILSHDEKQLILEKIIAHVNNKIEKALLKIKAYSLLTLDWPEAAREKIETMIKEKSVDLKPLKQVSFNSLKKLEELYKKAKEEKTEAETNQQHLLDYQALIKEAKKLVISSKSKENLKKAIENIEKINQKLLKNFETFDEYWDTLSLEMESLKSLMKK